MNKADKEEEIRGFASFPLLGHPETLEINRIMKTEVMMKKYSLLVPLHWDTLTHLKSEES